MPDSASIASHPVVIPVDRQQEKADFARRALTAKDWILAWNRNAIRPRNIPWTSSQTLSVAELLAVAPSIQEFQLGESSEGRNLIRCAEEHAAQGGDPDYPEAIRLFIGEEKRHSRELAQFMQDEGIPIIAKTPTDAIFRKLRNLAGLELMLCTLLTAEMVAMTYYRALRDSTESPVLKGICGEILRDEGWHIRFQCERIALLRARRSAPLKWLSLCLQVILHAGTLITIWPRHAPVYRRGGLDFRSWWRASWRVFAKSVRLIEGTHCPPTRPA